MNDDDRGGRGMRFLTKYLAFWVVIVFGAFPAALGALRVYCCRGCGVVTLKESRPTSYGCPASGTHSWHDVGIPGDLVYLCVSCRNVVAVQRQPASHGCPAAAAHRWVYLGRRGRRHYQCSRCRVSVLLESLPRSGSCPEGGSHSWRSL